MRAAALVLLLLAWGLPFALALPVLVASGLTLAAVPHQLPQLVLSLFIGTGSTLLAVVFSLVIVLGAPQRPRLGKVLGILLALPHLAFAIGFGFLIMPAGLLARLLQFNEPPQWVTTQDPLGLSLMAALVLKETPFLLWLLFAALARADFGRRLADEKRVAASLGHGSLSSALRVSAPQLLKLLRWPVLIVWVYGCSVIDMAIAIGPSQPAPYQIAVWHDLNDADALVNQRGLSGALLLAAALLVVAVIGGLLARLVRRPLLRFLSHGPATTEFPRWMARGAEFAIVLIYALVIIVLIIIACSARWPFPQLLPDHVDFTAWHTLAASATPLLNSLGFALATSAGSLLLAVTWFEAVPEAWDRPISIAAMAALVLPAVALASGQYVLFLRAGVGGGWPGVLLAQMTPVFAYVFMVLRAPYRALDPRYRSVANGLNAGHARFYFHIKGPLLLPVMASAAAIGFAVSIAQYVPVQLIGGGDTPTLTTEAVTLASGGNRPLLAAYALALMALPALAFGLAAWAGGRRGA